MSSIIVCWSCPWHYLPFFRVLHFDVWFPLFHARSNRPLSGVTSDCVHLTPAFITSHTDSFQLWQFFALPLENTPAYICDSLTPACRIRVLEGSKPKRDFCPTTQTTQSFTSHFSWWRSFVPGKRENPAGLRPWGPGLDNPGLLCPNCAPEQQLVARSDLWGAKPSTETSYGNKYLTIVNCEWILLRREHRMT